MRRLYLDTEQDQRILYWEQRLSSRQTYCLWEGQLMGPVQDEMGVEQGGPNSSDQYKIYNNEQLVVAQESGLGSLVGDKLVAAVGQADDSALCSNDINQLQFLLNLSVQYCEKYQVELSTAKTKLLVFTAKDTEYTKYCKLVSPIHIGSTDVNFVNNAEHVGITRSTSGNLPHIQQCISNHKKKLGMVLSSGMARRHRANPLASIKTEQTFGSPVLLSGAGSLMLSKSELDVLSHGNHPKSPKASPQNS